MVAGGDIFCNRQKDNAVYKSLQEYDIMDGIDNGVIKDEKIKIEKDGQSIELRRIAYWSKEHMKVYEFISNNYELQPDKIAEIYKRRWQIELFIQKIKTEFSIKVFLGEYTKCY